MQFSKTFIAVKGRAGDSSVTLSMRPNANRRTDTPPVRIPDKQTRKWVAFAYHLLV